MSDFNFATYIQDLGGQTLPGWAPTTQTPTIPIVPGLPNITGIVPAIQGLLGNSAGAVGAAISTVFPFNLIPGLPDLTAQGVTPGGIVAQLEEYAFEFASYIAANAVILMIVAFGLYLTFRPEIDSAVSAGIETAKKSGAAAEEVAA